MRIALVADRNNEGCDIHVSHFVPLDVVHFDTEQCCDRLTVESTTDEFKRHGVSSSRLSPFDAIGSMGGSRLEILYDRIANAQRNAHNQNLEHMPMMDAVPMPMRQVNTSLPLPVLYVSPSPPVGLSSALSPFRRPLSPSPSGRLRCQWARTPLP